MNNKQLISLLRRLPKNSEVLVEGNPFDLGYTETNDGKRYITLKRVEKISENFEKSLDKS